MTERKLSGPIFVAAFGTSTPFAYWGFGLLWRLVEFATGGAVHQIHSGTLAALREGWLQRGGKSVVLSADLPEAALTHFLAANPVQTIVFLDQPRDAILSAYASRNQSLEEAARISVQTFSAMAEPFCDSRALVIRRWSYKTLQDVVSDILSYLTGEEPSQGDIRTSIERAFAESLLNATLEEALLAYKIRGPFLADQDAAFTPEQERIVETIADSYAPLFEGRRPDEIIWPIDLFFTGDRRPILSTIDMAGVAGIFWGPYFNLPRGSWEARVTFEILGNYNPDPAIVDVLVGSQSVGHTVTLPREGIFSYALPFEVRDPNHSIEVRLIMTRGSIEGQFLLRRVSFVATRPQPKTVPQISGAQAPALVQPS